MGTVVGIDLAASPATTGVVVLRPGDERWVADVIEAADDDALVEIVRDAIVVGVDAPLGWPDAFVEAVTAHHAGRGWTAGADRTPLRYRATDLATRELVGGRLPLSVSTDLLGVVGLRTALLQQRWADEVWGGPEPRDGSGRLVETYPAAAFAAWGIDCVGYKHRSRVDAAREVRARIADELRISCRAWLDVDAIGARAVESDHVLDALVCALVAVAARSGATHRPPGAQDALARHEGWIHVPRGTLTDLGAPDGQRRSIPSGPVQSSAG